MNKPKKKLVEAAEAAEPLLDTPMDTAEPLLDIPEPAEPLLDTPMDTPMETPVEESSNSIPSLLQQTIELRDKALYNWLVVRNRWRRTGATQFDRYNALSYAVAPSISERITSRLLQADHDLEHARAEYVFYTRKASLLRSCAMLSRKADRDREYRPLCVRAFARLKLFLVKEANRKLCIDEDVPFVQMDAIATIGTNMGLAQAYGWVHYSSI